eukprot:TRINITY_DN45317_c0_g2_i1.p1 TRINITY_DN45317_c0_g2~~TRINITY_DN45317_c0_g2_i1.p1  ORF type:complete len:701 (+),score=101.20 TRINITY_DN45317_c0_g2_i1:101-2203(+)
MPGTMQEDLQGTLMKWFRERDQQRMIRTFDDNLLPRFGLDTLRMLDNFGFRQDHFIVHELVKLGRAEVLEHLVQRHGFAVNVQRGRDHNTPLHLSLWNKSQPMSSLLRRLGADETMKNCWGEDASAVDEVASTRQLSYSALVMACTEAREVLKLVDEHLSEFSALDTVTAYHRLGQLSSTYDPQMCKYSNSGESPCEGLPTLATLSKACLEAVEDDGASKWRVLLVGLSMFPCPLAVNLLAKRLNARPMPVESFDNHTHGLMLVFLAKIRAGAQFEECLRALGDTTARRIDKEELDLGFVSKVMWAFSKKSVHHSVLVRAVAKKIEVLTEDVPCDGQSASMLAWALAKQRTFQEPEHTVPRCKLALFIKSLVPKLDDQQTCNILWAVSKLRIAFLDLFKTLMDRANVVMYAATVFRYHERKSEECKIIQWSQVCFAYRYFQNSFPSKLGLLPQRLARDVADIVDGNVHEKLSHGSGLSVRSLRQLDDMLRNNIDFEFEWKPEDSLEAASADGIPEHVTQSNAQSARIVLFSASQPPASEMIQLINLKFARSPEALRRALMEGEELRTCRDKMQAAGFDITLDSGAKVFVKPEQYEPLGQKIKEVGVVLYSSNVIISKEFLPRLTQAVQRVPSRSVGKQARQQGLTITAPMSTPHDLDVEVSESVKSMEQSVGFAVKHTFINIVVPSSLCSVPIGRAVRSA